MSLLVVSEILGLFVNTITVNGKYSLHNTKNLRQPITMQLSKKKLVFSQFFYELLKSRSNFEHFEKNKKHDLHS